MTKLPDAACSFTLRRFQIPLPMNRISFLTLLVASLLLTSGFAADSAAGRVYRNGVIFTADGKGSIAEAVAIRDGRIVYVGVNGGVSPYVGPSTKVTDLK